MHSNKLEQAKNGFAFKQKMVFGILYLLLGTVVIGLGLMSWEIQNDIQSFQRRIQSLQENVQASKQSNSLDNPSLTLEKELAALEKERVELQSNSNIAVFQALGTLVIVLGFISTWRSQDFAEKNAAEVQKTANTVQLTHRFTEAVNQLGNDKGATRLGGIYALQSIATESEDYLGTVIKILCGFVRDQSLQKDQKEADSAAKGVSVDIQSALDFIGQSNHPLWYEKQALLAEADRPAPKHCFLAVSHGLPKMCDPDKPELDLSSTHLIRAKLAHQCFAKVNFRNALLVKADFLGSCLRGARFANAILSGADFREADLTMASFKNADLTQANFTNATLIKAIFSGANLEGANFQGVKAIDINQIQRANNWQLAKYDPDICEQLGLKTEFAASDVLDHPAPLLQSCDSQM